MAKNYCGLALPPYLSSIIVEKEQEVNQLTTLFLKRKGRILAIDP
jgi:hypothetical protein